LQLPEDLFSSPRRGVQTGSNLLDPL
jgi:hypothetical protein